MINPIKSIILIKSIIYLTLILLISDCGEDNSNNPQNAPAKYGTLQGKVFIQGTNIPIVGAVVEVDQKFSSTDTGGKYNIIDITAGSQTLKVSRDEYIQHIETITISEGTNTKNVFLINSQTPVVYGKVTNILGDGIYGATITINSISEETDLQGNYSIELSAPGDYEIKVEVNNYEPYIQTFNLPTSGSKNLNITLKSSILPQIQNLQIEDKNHALLVSWNPINLNTIKGYNVYIRYYLLHNYSMTMSNGIVTSKYSNWSKINVSLINESQFQFSTEEYNGTYEVYVLPVNIDGLETLFNNSLTKVEKEFLPSNSDRLGSFELTDNYGPIILSSDFDEISIRLIFSYNNLVGFFEPENWSVQVSENGTNWTTIGQFGIDVFGSLIPEDNAGGIESFSLNQYKDKSVYFRTIPENYGTLTMSINNIVWGWKY